MKYNHFLTFTRSELMMILAAPGAGIFLAWSVISPQDYINRALMRTKEAPSRGLHMLGGEDVLVNKIKICNHNAVKELNQR
jgi:hypothetical protein